GTRRLASSPLVAKPRSSGTFAAWVHDENAVVPAGVCGHAGLFAPLTDMDRLGRVLAAGGEGLLSAPGFARMTACHTEGLPLRRCLGRQGLDAVGSPVGTAMGPSSYGHTGFTGTSLWVEPAVDGAGAGGRYYVLLTSRVHPSRDPRRLPAVRRAFHHHAAASPAGVRLSFGACRPRGSTAGRRDAESGPW
ncbi:serine hydrolase, partial [Streptomyces melanosporofaciens]